MYAATGTAPARRFGGCDTSGVRMMLARLSGPAVPSRNAELLMHADSAPSFAQHPALRSPP